MSSSSSSNEPSPHLTTLKHPPVVEGNLYSFNSSFPPDPLPASLLTLSSSWSTSASASSTATPIAPAPSSAPSGPTPSPPASYASLMLPMSPHNNAPQPPMHRVGPSSSGSGSASTRLVSRHLPPSSRVSATHKSPLLQSRVILNVVRDSSTADSVGFVSQHASAAGVVPLEGPTATRVTVSPVQPKAPGERAPSRSPLSSSPRTLTSFSTESSTNNSPADRVRRTPLMMDGATNSPSPAPIVHCDAAEPFVQQSSSPADQPCANAQAFLLGLVHKNSK